MTSKKVSEDFMVKMTKPWTGKKDATNPQLKEAHKERKVKKELINTIKQKEWEKQVRDYDYK